MPAEVKMDMFACTSLTRVISTSPMKSRDKQERQDRCKGKKLALFMGGLQLHMQAFRIWTKRLVVELQ
jgi:hypothetical protein